MAAETRGNAPAWISRLAKRINSSITDMLADAMLEHGEDPADDSLWKARKAQLNDVLDD